MIFLFLEFEVEQIFERNYPVSQEGNLCFLTSSIRILVGMTLI